MRVRIQLLAKIENVFLGTVKATKSFETKPELNTVINAMLSTRKLKHWQEDESKNDFV